MLRRCWQGVADLLRDRGVPRLRPRLHRADSHRASALAGVPLSVQVMPPLTAEQVIALAPDAAALKAGRGLAAARHWLVLGRDDRAVWGECQGSARLPYQAQVDCDGPAWRCTCPSRKLPCKHVLGLLLLRASGDAAIPIAEPPGWVAEWLESRDARALKAAAPIPERTEQTAQREAAREQRADARLAKLTQGVEELQRWLEDLLRLGLAASPQQPVHFWEGMAARLVDAQASGLARLVRELAGVPFSGAGWEERLLAALGRMQLLLDAFHRLDALPEPVQADVLATIGLAPRQEVVLAGAPVGDCWLVLGERTEGDGRLHVRRTWLRGREGGRDALLLAFAPQHATIAPGPPPGSAIQAELCFYPGNWPLRAVVHGAAYAAQPFISPPGHATIGAALAAWTAALSHNPWLEQAPMALSAVLPARRGDAWFVDDINGQALPLTPAFTAGWRLLALSGGRPIWVFGEWDGRWLLPLGAATGEEFCRL